MKTDKIRGRNFFFCLLIFGVSVANTRLQQRWHIADIDFMLSYQLIRYCTLCTALLAPKLSFFLALYEIVIKPRVWICIYRVYRVTPINNILLKGAAKSIEKQKKSIKRTDMKTDFHSISFLYGLLLPLKQSDRIPYGILNQLIQC